MSGVAGKEPETIVVKMTLSDCAEYCEAKVRKLGPGKRASVLNAIKNTFNFKADITDDQAEKIYTILKNRRVFGEEGGKIFWP
ncbi:MAG: hypothetical protein MJ249_06175 [Kiritimatiellae bacterium]|nr:hypothetical protein [Kiritimatiellia bacterium]